MYQHVFKRIRTPHLIQVASNKLGGGEEYKRFFETLDAFPNKDSGGRPIDPRTDGPNHPRYIEIGVSEFEARQLGIEGSRISLHELNEIVSGETVIGRPVTAAMQGVAAYLRASGVRCNDQNGYTSAITPYMSAMRAYDFLAEAAAGSRIMLGKIRSSGAAEIFVTGREWKALQEGKFDSLDGIVSATEQAGRARLVEAMNHAIRNNYVNRGSDRFVYALEKIREVEEIMQQDPLAAWLRDNVKRSNVPIISFEVVDPQAKNFNLGQYIVNADIVKGKYGIGRVLNRMEYILFCTNVGTRADRAVTYAHESRHFWQQREMELHAFRSSPFDCLVFHILREADARAVGGKIEWSFTNKGMRLESPEIAGGFEQHFRRAARKATSRPQQLKIATREEFLRFLEEELSSLIYIKPAARRFWETPLSVPADSNTVSGLLGESWILRPQYLRQLSQVGVGSPYMDDGGIKRTQELLREKLPRALARVKTEWSMGTGPSS